MNQEDPPDSAVAVLSTRDQVLVARQWLRSRGWDIQRKILPGLAYGLRTGRRIRPEFFKSWDVARFARVLTASLPPAGSVLDIGSVASELPWVLHMAGFTDITGCDLDQTVLTMPFARTIRYRVGEPESLGLASKSLDAVTAVSTIEHGVDLPRFLNTAAQLLKPGGLLCISTDYWPEKIDTCGMQWFGLPWTVFSEFEIRQVIQDAADRGLSLKGWDGRIPKSVERVVSWNGRRYTFIALTFSKA
jgi:SAM-dependent methyltransferase